MSFSQLTVERDNKQTIKMQGKPLPMPHFPQNTFSLRAINNEEVCIAMTLT